MLRLPIFHNYLRISWLICLFYQAFIIIYSFRANSRGSSRNDNNNIGIRVQIQLNYSFINKLFVYSTTD